MFAEPVCGKLLQKAALVILDVTHDSTGLGIDYTFYRIRNNSIILNIKKINKTKLI